MYELFLAHHGIKGQRWGVRRYQNPDGTLTEAGKKHYSDAVESTPRHKPSEARKKAREEERARKFEEKRQQALKTGSATEVMKYKNFSTQKELQDAISRINMERTLKQLSDAELNSGKKFIDRVVDTADTWRARGEKVASVWNFVAKIHNSLVDEDDAWQKIGEKSVSEAKRERAEKKAKEAEDKEIAKMISESKVYKDLDVSYDDLKKYVSAYDKKDAKAALDYLVSKKQLKEANEAEDRKRKEASDKAERERKEKEAKAENERKEAAAKAEREAKERRDKVQASYFMYNGSVADVLKNKDLFTPEQFTIAIGNAMEREEKDKKKG